MVYMNLPLGTITSSSFVIGQKGRVMLPAAVRRAARLEDGTEVVARPDGEGRIVIESVAAIRARLWGSAPSPTGLDAQQDVRQMRQEDQRVVEANSARQAVAPVSEQGSEQAGQDLLAFLGLFPADPA